MINRHLPSKNLRQTNAYQCISKPSQEVEKFRTVQQASRQLYEALSQTCKVHAQHLALLCVEAAFTTFGQESRCPEIRFHLSFTHHDPGTGSISPLDPNEETTKNISLPLTRRGEQSNVPSNEGQFCQQCDCTARNQHTEPPKVSVCHPSWFEVQTILLNRMISSQKVLGQPISIAKLGSQTREFLGILDETEGYKQIISGPSTSISPRTAKTSTSLRQLIKNGSAKRSLGGMPQFQCLHLAKCLALAVLQFHATPWLGEDWQSEDVVFHDDTEKGEEQQNLLPHLHTMIAQARHKDNSIRETEISRSSLSVKSIVPNMLLFNLGVMLLELAYGTPFKTLQQPEDVAASPDSGLIDLVTARRLADGVGTSLGATFASIVRKCLRCDFGCGEDLDDPKLQSRLYEDVVCKLETLEDGFRRLQESV